MLTDKEYADIILKINSTGAKADLTDSLDILAFTKDRVPLASVMITGFPRPYFDTSLGSDDLEAHGSTLSAIVNLLENIVEVSGYTKGVMDKIFRMEKKQRIMDMVKSSEESAK